MSDPLSPKQLKKDFPFLKYDLAYLDSAATAQKPQQVIDAIDEYYTKYCANVHRGIYKLSEEASERFENVREQVRGFIGAKQVEEIIFTSGTTQSLNLAARLLVQKLTKGDEIVLTELEHHANLIPWQMIAKEHGYKLKFLKTNDQDELDIEKFEELITEKTKVLSLTHVSNVSGYVTPIKDLAKIAHKHNITVVVDGAQSVPHFPVDVVDLGVDMYAFSAHKMCGPTGVGVLYGRKDLLETFEPVFGGGTMIRDVEFETSTWEDLPLRLEPGTPNIAGVIGLGAAIDYLESIGLENVNNKIEKLFDYAWDKFQELDGVKIFGPEDKSKRIGILSFAVEGIHPHDIASILDEAGVAVRAGHHCAQPLLKCWGVPATARASLYFYNTKADVDKLVDGIKKAQEIFAPEK